MEESEQQEGKTPGKKADSNTRSSVNAILVPFLAVLTAMIVGGIVIALAGGNPFAAYAGLFQGAFGSLNAISETMVWASPYIFAGLAVAIAFKGGLFNIGAEGQLALGAVAAAWVGYALPEMLGVTLPAIIHIPLAIFAGLLAGAIWGAIPGWLKARTGAHEVINTIMMNYIALNIVSFLLNGPMKDPNPLNVIARTPEIAAGARIPPLFEAYRVHWGFILALVMAVVIWWLLWKTTLGFEIRTVGANPDAARYAGINVPWITVVTMALSGMMAGFAGVIEVTALNYRHELGFSVGYGFDAIAIALLGKNHPLGVVLGSPAVRRHAQRGYTHAVPHPDPGGCDFDHPGAYSAFRGCRCYCALHLPHPRPQERVVLTRGWGG